MKGLIRKDLYLSASLLKVGIGIWVFAFCFCLGTKSNTYGVMMAMIYEMSVLMSTMTADGKGGWAYALQGPVSRDQIVLEKYGYCMVMNLVLLAAGICNGAAATVFWNLSWEDLLIAGLLNLVYGFYLNAALLPLFYKIGPEHMQLAVLLAMLLPFILIIGAIYWVSLPGNLEIPARTAYQAGAAGLAVMFLLWIGSFFLSRRIFREREID